MAKKKNAEITPYQINLDNLVMVEGKQKEAKITFHKILLDSPSQISFFKKDLASVFSNSLIVEQFEKSGEVVKPKFNLIFLNEQYAFVIYSNTKKFDDHMAKMLKENKEILDADKYEFEYFLFSMIDLKNSNMVIINNKKASCWKYAFEELFRKNGLTCSIIPFRDSAITEQLQKQGLKNITFSTASKDKISKNITYADCFSSDFIEKCSVNLKFKNPSSNRTQVFDYINKSFIQNKSGYSKIQIEAESGIIDILKDTITKSINVTIPKTYDKDSVQMQSIQKILQQCLESIK